MANFHPEIYETFSDEKLAIHCTEILSIFARRGRIAWEALNTIMEGRDEITQNEIEEVAAFLPPILDDLCTDAEEG